MRAKDTHFEAILTGEIVFVIPVYQRNYDWKEENCKQLFFDILRSSENNKEHFIGTICCKPEGRHKTILVDGQQRITSLMLLLKALYDFSNDNKLKNRIYNKFLINPYTNDDGDNELKIKLKPIKKDEAVYKNIISNDNLDLLSNSDKRSNLAKNYLKFKDLMLDNLKDENSIHKFEDAIENLSLVEIELESENPQVIFESLNSTGVDLTNTDLLRNFLLMSLPYERQQQLYLKYWAKIEELVNEENIENFMIYYLILKRKKSSIMYNNKKLQIGINTLYVAFKDYLKGDLTDEKIESTLRDIYKYAKYYHQFIFNNDDSFPLEGFQNKFFQLFYLLENKEAAILVLFLYEQYENKIIDDKTFLLFLDALISFSFRSLICSTTGLSKQFAALMAQKLDAICEKPLIKYDLMNGNYKQYIERFWDELTSGKGSYSFPKDKEFCDTLMSIDLYQKLKSKKCKYMLYMMELNVNPKECPIYSTCSIEHIMPQHLSLEWKDYLNTKIDFMNYDRYKHNLGNLTLTGYNSEIGNELFVCKKEDYLKSAFYYTRKIGEKYKDWTSKEISNRAKELANMSTKIWKLPDKYNKEYCIDTGITYNLDSDLASFSGTKPYIVCVIGDDEEITNWNEFARIVCKKLYELDKELFLEMLDSSVFSKRQQIIDTIKKPNTRYEEIDDSLYINVNNGTENNLKNIKEIVEYFDKIADTNFKDDIWFTLRKT